MDVAHVEVPVAAVDRTGAIHRPQRGALWGGGQASGSSDVEGHAVAAEHDGDEVGVAGVASCGFDRDRGPVGVLTHAVVVTPLGQRDQVDQHRDLGGPHP